MEGQLDRIKAEYYDGKYSIVKIRQNDIWPTNDNYYLRIAKIIKKNEK